MPLAAGWLPRMGTRYLHELVVADEAFIGEDLVDGDGADMVVTCEGKRDWGAVRAPALGSSQAGTKFEATGLAESAAQLGLGASLRVEG